MCRINPHMTVMFIFVKMGHYLKKRNTSAPLFLSFTFSAAMSDPDFNINSRRLIKKRKKKTQIRKVHKEDL